MTTDKNRGPTAIFLLAVAVAGSLAIARSLYQLSQATPQPAWLLFALLALVSAFFTVKVPSVPATISVSETFVFTSVLLFGTPAATVTVAVEALIMSAWRHRRDPRKVLFNATEPAFSIWVASELFALTLGQPTAVPNVDVSSLILPVMVLCLTYFFVNSTLAAVAVWLETGTPVLKVWQNYFVWLFLNYLAAASVAVLIAHNSQTVGLSTLGIILPLLVVSYFTMKSSMGRVEDANTHVAAVERLYLSTIETLAMAVDAKDQVTHGHIRRVQAYAVALAKQLGLKEPVILSAIEASALLHDMGKLAVPEHILNKPGKLTAAEFDQMKLHASVGADILSAIDFPYPVVPIVRHHHENWDGTGYPDGIRGQDIPIGARILSVVDCFDALTSDRPYRGRLSDEDALNILRERRGSMYDPFVVDAFIAAYPKICGELQTAQGPALESLHRATRSGDVKIFSEPASDITNDDVFDAPRALSQSQLLFSAYFSQCFRDAYCVLYIVDVRTNELFASVTSPPDGLLCDIRIPVGRGVSGWVAANRQVVMDSDSALDLGANSREFVGSYCMSAPIATEGDGLIGVLTIYGRSAERFAERDRAVLELMAQVLSSQMRELTPAR